MSIPPANDKPFKISVLIFIHDHQGRQLLLQRNKAPNQGCWSPVGGKLDMTVGESPFECAIREAYEETGMLIDEEDLHLFCMITEKDYEGTGHWLMFLFDCQKPIEGKPASFEEGNFDFFAEEDIPNIKVPETDKEALWPLYFEKRKGFCCLRATCSPGQKLDLIPEETIL